MYIDIVIVMILFCFYFFSCTFIFFLCVTSINQSFGHSYLNLPSKEKTLLFIIPEQLSCDLLLSCDICWC